MHLKNPVSWCHFFGRLKFLLSLHFLICINFLQKYKRKKLKLTRKVTNYPHSLPTIRADSAFLNWAKKKIFFEHAFRRKTEMVPFCERFSCDWVFLLIWGIATFRPENSNAIILTEQWEFLFRWQKSLMKRSYRFSQNRSTNIPERKKMKIFFKQSSILMSCFRSGLTDQAEMKRKKNF